MTNPSLNHEGAIAPEKLVAIPEILPRTCEYIAAAASTERKAAAFGSMVSGVDYSQGGFREQVLDLTGVDSELLGRRTAQMGYSVHSFEPYGLATIDTSTKPKTTRITEEGHEYAQPLTYALLDLGDRWDIPLEGTFGQITHGSESIDNRLQVVKGLITNGQVARIADIKKKTGLIDETVGAHLRAMDRYGLAEYNPTSKISDAPHYEVLDPNAVTPTLTSPISKAILAYISEHPSGTTDEIYKHCRDKNIGEMLSQRSLKQSIAKRLNEFAASRPNFLSYDKFPTEKATISDEQRAFWLDLFALLHEFQTSSPKWRQEWRERGYGMMQDSAFVARALERSKMHQRGKLAGLILSTLTDDEISAADMTQIFVAQGNRYSQMGVRFAARGLAKAGLIQSREGRNNIAVYSRVPVAAS